MADFEGKTVLIGVSGGIAAYKVVELARLLVKAGADVKVVMTDAGQRFVTPLTFRTVTGNPVATSMWSDPGSPFPHISLSEEADLIVVAPATADLLAKMANGIADDLLSTTLLAARGTVVVAPAMNARMFLSDATRANLELLRERGVVIVDPCNGALACGDEGPGRMAEPSEIMEFISREIGLAEDLAGRKVVVTAGPTREYLDPVRFISNPSTGRMGYTVAERAARRGANVVLVSGPASLPCPAGVQHVGVVSADEMKQVVLDNLGAADALIMAAAVGDYRPTEQYPAKIKKEGGVPEISLERTGDILKSVSEEKRGCIVVGFAAETQDIVENARRKLLEKNMDLVVANQVGRSGTGFGSSTNLAAIIAPDDREVELEMMSKVELADNLLGRLTQLLRART